MRIRLQLRRRSRTTAPATVLFSSNYNEKGQKQLCVYAECHYSGSRAGPIWSHTDAAVNRCLATLTHDCECGRRFHKAREYQGKRVTKRADA